MENELQFYCFIGRLEIAKLLIEHGADVNAKNPTMWTPLISATANG